MKIRKLAAICGAAAILLTVPGCNTATDSHIETECAETHYNVEELFYDLDEDASASYYKYIDKDIIVYGFIKSIDENGFYITLGENSADTPYWAESILCYFSNENLVNDIQNYNVDDYVRISAHVDDVNSYWGYTITISDISLWGVG